MTAVVLREQAERTLALDAEATAGPWEHERDTHGGYDSDAALIAEFRTLAPTLAREVLRLLAVEEAARLLAETYGNVWAKDGKYYALMDALLDERKMGQTPHRCLNDECGTISYGTGYAACPGCGGTEGREALAAAAAESGTA